MNPRVVVAIVTWTLVPTIVACGGGGTAAASPPLPPSDPAEIEYAPELAIDLADFERTASGLYLQDVQVGDGPVANRTSRVWVRYVGWLPDGTAFDGNVGREPYHLRLGGSEVIRGWNEGIVGMRRGGIRKLIVRPGLAYGSRGSGRNVPPGATLIFLLELVDVG
jgi:FKBP-type peptidyl-prolyl cis-trans isomerase